MVVRADSFSNISSSTSPKDKRENANCGVAASLRTGASRGCHVGLPQWASRIMGRPPIGTKAMSATERVYRFRAKHGKRRRSPTGPLEAAKDPPLAARIRELEAALARALGRVAELARSPAAPLADTAKDREIAELNRRLAAAHERIKQLEAGKRRRIGDEPTILRTNGE